MMEVRLMNKTLSVANNISVHDLLVAQDFRLENYAVMVNNCFIPRVNHKSTWLHHKDVIELISPMQGG